MHTQINVCFCFSLMTTFSDGYVYNHIPVVSFVLLCQFVSFTGISNTIDSLSRPRLSRITAYLEVKSLSLPKHENLTTGKKGAISPLFFRNIFNISLTSRV